LLISLEYLVLGVLFYVLTVGLNFNILFFIIIIVLSRVLGLILFVGLIKNYGSDISIYCDHSLKRIKVCKT